MAIGLSTVPSIQESVLPYEQLSSMSVTLANQVRLMQTMKSVYQADQQIKLLNLQAEVDSLWQQLQNLKQQRTASDN